jgi:general stress protein 26
MAEALKGPQALEKIRQLIKDIDIGMMTTRNGETNFKSRPMSSNGDVSEDGTLWFFTRRESNLVQELESNPEVHVSFSNPEKHLYVSVSGTAEIITDELTLKYHWKPQLKAWFPDGLESPDITLIRVRMEEGEYWESKGNLLSHTLSFAKSMVTGEPLDVSEYGSAKPHHR